MIRIIIILIALSAGCSSVKESDPQTIDGVIPNWENQNLHDLLHIGNKHAYKSITKEDYEIKENCG